MPIWCPFSHICDWSVPYCASLEVWNWVVAEQHLNGSQPRSTVWPNQNVTIFSGNYFWKTLNSHITLTFRIFDLIPKLSYHMVLNIPRDSHRHFLQIETIRSSLHNHSRPQKASKNLTFRTSILSEMGLQPKSHIYWTGEWVFYTINSPMWW